MFDRIVWTGVIFTRQFNGIELLLSFWTLPKQCCTWNGCSSSYIPLHNGIPLFSYKAIKWVQTLGTWYLLLETPISRIAVAVAGKYMGLMYRNKWPTFGFCSLFQLPIHSRFLPCWILTVTWYFSKWKHTMWV